MPQDTKSIGNTPYLEMKPKDRVLVKFNFEVPPDVPAGDHQVLIFFEMFDFVKQAEGAVSKVSGRLGSRLRIRVQGEFVEKLDLRPLAVRAFIIGNTIPYVFTSRNEGNIDKQIDTSISVFDRNEDEVLSSSIASETTLFAKTSSEKSGKLALKGMPIGKFTVKVTMKYAKEGAPEGAPLQEIVKERDVWVFPLWLVIAVVVVLGGLLMWASWRGAVRAARRRLERDDKESAENAGAHEDGLEGSSAPAEDPAGASARSRASQDLWDDDDIDFVGGMPQRRPERDDNQSGASTEN